MVDLLSKIAELLLQNKSTVLIGSSDSGKTYWVEHELIPFLRQNKKVIFFKNGEAIQNTQGDIFIFDEAETLFDEHFLANRHSDEHPYYDLKYLEKVRGWHKRYAQFPEASLFIISRDTKEEVDYLVENFKKADWDNRGIIAFKFEK
jgi:hypothetical protein